MHDPSTIYQWRRVNDRLTTSGQPTEEHLAELKALGVSYVINLGMHDHERALEDEASSVAKLGMVYVHIPVEMTNPKETDFEQFCTAMADAEDSTVHVHCIANLRVTAFLYRFHRDVLGLDEEQARKIMDTVWQPGGIWAAFIGDEESIALDHRPPRNHPGS
ncbi:MAG: protein tyrosine phosphatase family protein [Pseudomonadota bacterium]